MQNKKNVVIAVLAVLAVVFAILFFTKGGLTQKDVDDAKKGLFTQEDVDKKIEEAATAAKEGLLGEDAVNTKIEEAVTAAKEGLPDEEAVKSKIEEAVTAAKEGLLDEEAVKAKIEEAVTAAKEGLLDEEAVKSKIEEAVTAAKEGLFDQAALDEAVAAAKEGLLDEEAVKAKVEEAVTAAKEGLFDEATVNSKVEEAVNAAKEEAAGQIEELNKTITELKEKLEAPAAAAVEAVEETVEKAGEAVAETVEKVEEAVAETGEKVEEAVSETVEKVEEAVTGEVKVMSHEEYVAADLDTEVTVETYVQATQNWWDNKITVYAQSEDGAYFIYNMPCSEEDAAKLVPGTKIRVKGFKAEWSGEVEIIDSSFEIIDGEAFIAEPEDVTALLGKEELINSQNKLVAFKGMTVEAYDENGAAFAYKDAEGKTDDLYFKVSKDGETYGFCVEFYLCGKDTEVYKAVEALNVGDVIDLEGFLYWYNGLNPHITKITPAQ